MAPRGGNVNISPAADAPFGNEEAFLDFLGANEIAHIAFGAALARLGYVVSAPPPLGNPLESEDWLNDHWQRHKDECAIFGVSVPDLSAADLTDESQYSDWMTLHTNLHSAQNAALGITS